MKKMKFAHKWQNPETKLPTTSGHYWVLIEGDSEMDDCGGMLYEYEDFICFMDITVEDDGPDNPPYITGYSDTDISWDMVCGWWDERIDKPDMPSVKSMESK